MKTLFLLLISLSIGGCARFNTTQTDLSHEEGQPVRQITTKATAYTLFTSRSALANFKASQTDKTQGASVGSLTQESSGTNAVQALEAVANILKALK